LLHKNVLTFLAGVTYNLYMPIIISFLFKIIPKTINVAFIMLFLFHGANLLANIV